MPSADLQETKAAETERQEEAQRPLRQVGLEPQAEPVRHGRQLLARLALLLVSLGGRLVRYGLPPYCPAGEKPKGKGECASP